MQYFHQGVLTLSYELYKDDRSAFSYKHETRETHINVLQITSRGKTLCAHHLPLHCLRCLFFLLPPCWPVDPCSSSLNPPY